MALTGEAPHQVVSGWRNSSEEALKLYSKRKDELFAVGNTSGHPTHIPQSTDQSIPQHIFHGISEVAVYQQSSEDCNILGNSLCFHLQPGVEMKTLHNHCNEGSGFLCAFTN